MGDTKRSFLDFSYKSSENIVTNGMKSRVEKYAIFSQQVIEDKTRFFSELV